MRRVADETGISLGNLQYHYKTREELLATILDDFLSNYLSGNWEKSKKDAAEPSPSLEQVFLQILTHDSFDDCTVVFKEIWSLAQRNAGIDQLLVDFYQQSHRFLCQLLSSTSTSAVEQEKAERTADILLPFLEGYCVTRKALRSDPGILSADLAHLTNALLSQEPIRD